MMEFDEIAVKESPGVCRCCLSEGCYKDLGSEYTWMNDTEVYAEMLLDCFDISISKQNDGPNGANRLICEVCITRLRDACNFKKQVLDSEKKFIDMVARSEFQPNLYSTIIVKSEKESHNESVDIDLEPEGEVEFLEDDMDFDDDDTLKDDEPSGSGIELPEIVKPKRGRPKNPNKPQKKSKVVKTEEKPNTSKAVVKGSEATKNSANHKRRKNLQILFNNTTLLPFKWRGSYMCFFCGDDFVDYESLRKHTDCHIPCGDNERALRLVKSNDSEVKLDVSDIRCRLCSESFPEMTDVIEHLKLKHNIDYNSKVDLMITSYRLKDLKCLNCGEGFEYFKKLITHLNTQHPINCFSCKECKKDFNKKRDLNSHIRKLHKKDYSCVKCNVTFSSNSALQLHKSSHTPTCNICLKTFPCNSIRLQHLKVEHCAKITKCSICNKELSTKQAFLRHSAKCFNENLKQKPITIDDSSKKQNVRDVRNSLACILNMSTVFPFKFFMNRFRCFYCSIDFETSDILREHTFSEHPVCDSSFKAMKLKSRYDGILIKVDISSVSCKLCFQSFEDLNSLINHLTTEHKAKCDNIESSLQPFKLVKDHFECPLCGEIYRYFGLLLKHISKGHADNKHICVYCGDSFRTDPNLRAHVNRYHRNAGKHQCPQCDLTFPFGNALKSHLGSVHGTKPYKCVKCSEDFVSIYSMQRHLLISHETGHKCSYCGKLFIKYSYMVNHIRRSHLKEKNVECPVCFERFFDNHRLKMHVVKHVGERNYHCDLCDKKFLWKKNLRGHMQSHIRNGSVLVQDNVV